MSKRERRERLFFALWPDDSLRARLAALTAAAAGLRGRAVARENLHLTLVFLGALDEGQKACAEQVADEVRSDAFSLVLDHSGHWRGPQVLWVGASSPPRPLRALVETLHLGLEPCGHRPDNRPFRAHVTLMRKAATPPPELRVEPLHWPVREFCLIRSETLPEGARYRVLRTWPLRRRS